MTDQEFEKQYGRPPVKPGQHPKVKIYWHRIFIALAILVLVIVGIVKLISGIVGAVKGNDGNTSSTTSAQDSQGESSSDDAVATATGNQVKVCIDAGHGGDDGGAQNLEATRFEKDDNLQIALKVRDYLEAQGVAVVMVRDYDTFVSLDDICSIANDANADLFLSLHRNSSDSEYSGVEVWVHNSEPAEDTLLATNIMNSIAGAGVNDNRGVQYGYIGEPESNYQVNRCTNMPSCLVEMGFITNDSDNDLFDEKLDDYAKAIADAIVKSAVELNIIDENGTRIMDTPCVSSKPKADNSSTTDSYTDDKYYVTSNLSDDSSDDTSAQ